MWTAKVKLTMRFQCEAMSMRERAKCTKASTWRISGDQNGSSRFRDSLPDIPAAISLLLLSTLPWS